MTRVFTYLPKRLLFVALMLAPLLAAAQAPTCEVQLCQEEVAAIVNSEKSYVFVGEEASSVLETMKTILALADAHDVVPNMRTLAQRAEQGFKTAPKEMVLEALEKEAPALLEKHHAKIHYDEQVNGLVKDLDAACELVSSDALTIAVESTRSGGDYADDEERGCGKSEKLCNLTVTGPATIRSLNVTGDEVVGGNLRVGGTLVVGGATTLSNLTVTGNEVINGTLTIGGVVVNPASLTNAYVQGGNSFGATGELGINDGFGLNLRTRSLDRIEISADGAVNIVAPVIGNALTVNANAVSNALVVAGGAGATAAIITPAATVTGLQVGDSTTAPSVIVDGAEVVNNGANATFTAFPTTHTYPLFVGGTQVAQTPFTGGGANNFATGAPRMIWAQINHDGNVLAQSGGITDVVFTTPGGVPTYTITYAGFAVAPIVLSTADTFNAIAAPTGDPSTTSVAIQTTNNGTPSPTDFSILIMGLAS